MTLLQASGGSVHSPSDRLGRRSPTWDGSPATDFAITTVNVPDRLDVQEVRARAEEDEYSRRSWFSLDRYLIQVWLKRLLVMGVLGTVGYFGYQAIAPLRSEFTPATISERLTKSSGQPISIAGRTFRHSPTPRMVLTGIELPGEIRIDEIALHFNWDEAVRAAKSGGWAWGEAEVAPLSLSRDQALGLLVYLPRLMSAMPTSVSTVRFTSLQFPDYPLLQGRFQLVLRRDVDGGWGPMILEQRTADGGVKLTLTPATSAEEGTRFHLEAQRWVAPIGPSAPWSEVVATGWARPGLIQVDSYTAAGFYGVTQGLLVAASDVAWSVTGTARSTGIDLEALFRHLQGPGRADVVSSEGRTPMVGTASITLVAGGHGETLDDAVANSRVAGPVQVRWGTLNGINLGLAATQGGGASAGSGITRFTELDAAVIADRNGVLIRDIAGRAGAMLTRGEISVTPSLALSGALRVDLGAQRVQAPLNLRVRGTALSPQFGR